MADTSPEEQHIMLYFIYQLGLLFYNSKNTL
jgi:hypothetical protein